MISGYRSISIKVSPHNLIKSDLFLPNLIKSNMDKLNLMYSKLQNVIKMIPVLF